MTRLMSVGAIALAVAAATITTTASARPAASPLLGKLEACRSITGDQQRLACFDRESASLATAIGSGVVTVVDQGQMREVRRSLFGFQLPRMPFFDGDKSADNIPVQLDSTIRSVGVVGRDRYRITLADGAVWETIDSPMRLVEPKAGQKIVVRRASLGSYFLRFEGQLGVKGRRVK